MINVLVKLNTVHVLWNLFIFYSMSNNIVEFKNMLPLGFDDTSFYLPIFFVFYNLVVFQNFEIYKFIIVIIFRHNNNIAERLCFSQLICLYNIKLLLLFSFLLVSLSISFVDLFFLSNEV